MTVKLDDVMEAIYFANPETEFYYDTATENVILYMHDMIDGEEDNPLLQELLENPLRFISLPSQYAINEYDIMENFIFGLTDNRTQKRFYNAIHRRGAFLTFFPFDFAMQLLHLYCQ